jgi:hypothetical protein
VKLFCDRRQAVETILKGFTPPAGKNIVPFPLSRLLNILGFEDEAECAR